MIFGHQTDEAQAADDALVEPSLSLDDGADTSAATDQSSSSSTLDAATPDESKSSTSESAAPSTKKPSSAPETPSATRKKPETPAATGPGQDDLLALKLEALHQLTPLVHQLDQSPEERFRTTMMMIQSTDNQALIKDAYAAAQSISDDKVRAQALLDIINEINYFTIQKK